MVESPRRLRQPSLACCCSSSSSSSKGGYPPGSHGQPFTRHQGPQVMAPYIPPYMAPYIPPEWSTMKLTPDAKANTPPRQRDRLTIPKQSDGICVERCLPYLMYVHRRETTLSLCCSRLIVAIPEKSSLSCFMSTNGNQGGYTARLVIWYYYDPTAVDGQHK